MERCVVVFHEEEILVARGREGAEPRIKALYRAEPEGYGDSFERWKEGLRELSPKIGDMPVRLVLPAAMCQERCVNFPRGRKKELAAMAEREFQESLKSDLTDYAVIGERAGSGVCVVGGGVERRILEWFVSICVEAGLAVDSVTVPMEGAQRILAHFSGGEMETAIFLFFEEGSVLSVLQEKGQYKYSGRSRLLSEPGTLDFGTEIVRIISGILQFQTASKSGEAITDVYYAGCLPEDFEACLPEIEAMNLKAAPFEDVDRIRMPRWRKASDYLSCVGALMGGMREKRDMNLLAAFRREAGAAQVKRLGQRHAWPVAATAGLCLLCLVGLGAFRILLDGRIRVENAWMEAAETKTAYGEAAEKEQKLLRLKSAVRDAELAMDNLETYPVFTREAIGRIEGAGSGVTLRIRGFESSTGTLLFDAKSREVIDIPSYIEQLRQIGLFHTVDYTGYHYEGEVYTLSVSCTMEERR